MNKTFSDTLKAVKNEKSKGPSQLLSLHAGALGMKSAHNTTHPTIPSKSTTSLSNSPPPPPPSDPPLSKPTLPLTKLPVPKSTIQAPTKVPPPPPVLPTLGPSSDPTPHLPSVKSPTTSSVTVSGTLEDLKCPRRFVCISESWPSQAIAMMALKLDLAAAFLPKRFLYLLHPFGFPAHIDSLERAPLGIPANCCYVISGSISFIRRVLAYPHVEPEWSIIHAEFPFRDYPGSRAQSAYRYNLQQELLGLYLEPSNLSHFQFGGGTDAQYVVAVGRRADPEKRLRHCPPPPLRRGIRHFW